MAKERVEVDVVAQTRKAVGDFKKFAITIGGVTAALLAVRKGMSMAFDAAQYAGKVNQARMAFDSIAKSAGTTRKEVVTNLKKMSGETISELDLLIAASKASLLGLPADKLDELMQIARASATATGESVQKMFSDIVTGIGRTSPMILDNLGLVIKVGEANKEWAKKAGITVEQMTAQQRKMAMLNAVLKSGKTIMEQVGEAGQNLTDVERWQQLTATAADLKAELGQELLPTLIKIVQISNEWLSSMIMQRRALRGAIDVMKDQRDITAKTSDEIASQIEALEKQLAQQKDTTTIFAKAIKFKLEALKKEAAANEVAIQQNDLLAEKRKIVTELNRDLAKSIEKVAEAENKVTDAIAARDPTGGRGRLSTGGRGGGAGGGGGRGGAGGLGTGGGLGDSTRAVRELGTQWVETGNKMKFGFEQGQSILEQSRDNVTAMEKLNKVLEEQENRLNAVGLAMDIFSGAFIKGFEGIGAALAGQMPLLEAFGEFMKGFIVSGVRAIGHSLLATAGAWFVGAPPYGPPPNPPMGIASLGKAAAAFAAAGAIQALATGGIVKKPTLAMIGEAGPEAVIPLNRSSMGGITVIVQGSVVTEEQISRAIMRRMGKVYRGY